MAKIISISNQKGGVGKTTTTLNLGTALAIKGKKVLLVDFDPQANLSSYLGFEGDDNPTMSNLMLAIAENKPIDTASCIRTSEVNKVDFIPSDINLANADFYLSSTLSRETVLKRILNNDAVKEYDYVLIDCLPSLGLLLMNAFTCSDGIIIPVQVQKFALDGLSMLTGIYEQIRATINPSLDLVGVLATMVDNTNMSRTMLEKLSERYGDKLFGTVIHRSIEAANSSEKMRSLCLSKNKLGDEYLALADEVEGK